MSSSVRSTTKVEDDTKKEDAQSCTVPGWKPVQSATRCAASVMLQPQSDIAVAIIAMADAFWISNGAFLCIYPCKYDVPLLMFSLFFDKPHRVVEALLSDNEFLTRAL